MKIKDILNDISPRIRAKKDIKKRFKRRKGKDFHSSTNFDHKFKISNITKRIKGALCDDINDNTE
jgi:hypothetical protein|tara:strand:+ start:501 stop:695 length:195 start_codon:yes stop_codon:yes gene_type:complete